MENKTIKLKLSHLIIGGILLLLIIFLLKCNVNPTKINTYNKEKNKIDSLCIEINYLKKNQIKLNKNINKQILVIDSLNKEIKTTEKELIQTRTYYGSKIKNINSSSPSELNKFFTERYK
jgi:septal ring factor EnvC (AmiA/AmiB activator)